MLEGAVRPDLRQRSAPGPFGAAGPRSARSREGMGRQDASTPHVAALGRALRRSGGDRQPAGLGTRVIYRAFPEKRSVKTVDAATQVSLRDTAEHEEKKDRTTGLYPGALARKHPLSESLNLQKHIGQAQVEAHGGASTKARASSAKPRTADRRESDEEATRLLRAHDIDVLPTDRMSLLAREVDEFARPALAAAGAQDSEEADFNPGMHATVLYFVTDIPTLAQTIESTAYIAMNRTPDVGLGSGLKFSSALSMVTGAATIYTNTQEIKRAQAIGDVVGERLAQITRVRGVSEIATGAIMVPVRALSIAATYTTAQSVVTAGRILGDVSTGAASVLYALLALPFAIQGVRQMQFRGKFSDQLDLGETRGMKALYGMQFLVDQLTLSESEREGVVSALPVDDYDDLLEMLGEEVSLTEEEFDILTDEEFAFISRKTHELLAQIMIDHPRLSNREIISGQIKIRLAKELAKKMMVKEVELARTTGNKTVQFVKEQLHLPARERIITRLQADPNNELAIEEAENIIAIAKKENSKGLLLNTLIVLTCVIGIIGFILSSVFTAGLPLYIALGVIILSNVMMFCIDLYGFISEVKEMKSMPKDRAMMIFLSLLSMVFVAVGSVLATGPLATVIVLIVGLVFVGVQLGVLGWSWHNAEKDKAAKESGVQDQAHEYRHHRREGPRPGFAAFSGL